MLTYAQMREQHDLAIGKLKGIMVCAWIILVDLSESSHCVTDLLGFPLGKPQLKSRKLTLDFVCERDLCARKKAHSHFGFSHRRKPACRVFQNSVVTSLSPTFAGRDATSCRL
jgi:hypothetical protein